MNENLRLWLNRQNELYQKILGPSAALSATLNSHAKTIRSSGISHQVLHMANKVNAMNKPLRQYQQFADIVNTGRDISQSLGVLGGQAVLNKSFFRNQTTINALFPTTGLTKLLANNPGLHHLINRNHTLGGLFSTPILNSVLEMSKKYDGLFKSSFAIQQTMNAGLGGSLATQLSALQHSLAKVDINALRTAALEDDWEALEEYQAISEDVVTLSQTEESNNSTSRAAVGQLLDKLTDFYQRNKQMGYYAYVVIDILSIVLGLYAFYDDKIAEKPALLTLEQYQADQLAAKQERAIEREAFLQELRKATDYRWTKMVIAIKLKPNSKSATSIKLAVATKVQVLQPKGKWLFICGNTNKFAPLSPISN